MIAEEDVLIRIAASNAATVHLGLQTMAIPVAKVSVECSLSLAKVVECV